MGQRVGSIWWVKLPNASTVIKCKIMDMSEKVVCLQELRKGATAPLPHYYRTADIDFVEEIKE